MAHFIAQHIYIQHIYVLYAVPRTAEAAACAQRTADEGAARCAARSMRAHGTREHIYVFALWMLCLVQGEGPISPLLCYCPDDHADDAAVMSDGTKQELFAISSSSSRLGATFLPAQYIHGVGHTLQPCLCIIRAAVSISAAAVRVRGRVIVQSSRHIGKQQPYICVCAWHTCCACAMRTCYIYVVRTDIYVLLFALVCW